MSEAEEILSRVESRSKSFRATFSLALAGMSILVIAKTVNFVPDVIRAKSFQVLDGATAAAVIGVTNNKIILPLPTANPS